MLALLGLSVHGLHLQVSGHRGPVSQIQMRDRVFAPENAKGGSQIKPSTVAVLFIEYQNEFCAEGGKLYPAVKDCLQETNMIEKSVMVAEKARARGVKVMHAPIDFSEDGSDNPNKGLGILAGCANDKLFTRGTWNAEFFQPMAPQYGDIVVKGKRGLDAFPGTDLEELLVGYGIETIALCGLLTNCCVESTMRTAYEKGFNVITITDCTATTSAEGQTAATTGTYGMFSEPITAKEFMERLETAA